MNEGSYLEADEGKEVVVVVERKKERLKRKKTRVKNDLRIE